MARPAPATAADPVQENIETVLRLEMQAMRDRNVAERVAEVIADFMGSVYFLVLQIGWMAVWILLNTGLLPIIRAFDPFPFPLLCLIVSLEGVMIANFVLIKQNRMGYLSDRREHVDLQINLLAEREVTRLLQLTEQIATRLGVSEAATATQDGLSQNTELEQLVEAIDRRLGPTP